MRLIDADELKKKARWMKIPDRSGINTDVRAVSVGNIDLTPDVDAVPVVRCKSCRNSTWSKTNNSYYCKRRWAMHKVRERDFCSYGVRKEDA